MSDDLIKNSFDKLLFIYPNNKIEFQERVEVIHEEDLSNKKQETFDKQQQNQFFCNVSCEEKFNQFLNEKGGTEKEKMLRKLLLNAFNYGYTQGKA